MILYVVQSRIMTAVWNSMRMWWNPKNGTKPVVGYGQSAFVRNTEGKSGLRCNATRMRRFAMMCKISLHVLRRLGCGFDAFLSSVLTKCFVEVSAVGNAARLGCRWLLRYRVITFGPHCPPCIVHELCAYCCHFVLRLTKVFPAPLRFADQDGPAQKQWCQIQSLRWGLTSHILQA